MALAAWAGNAGAAALPRYDLAVSVDTENGRVLGTARVFMPEGREGSLSFPPALKPLSITSGGTALAAGPSADGPLELPFTGEAEVTYEGRFPSSARASIENSGVVPSAIGPEGISLTEGWYPRLAGEELVLYRLRASVPEGFEAISEADEIVKSEAEGGMVEFGFRFPGPLPALSLAAGRYEVRSGTLDDIGIYAYFFAEDAALADEYIRRSKEYLRMHGEMLGPYPYKRFSVVENFLESGYSMPTFTLLGRTVIKLPFILETSLGHEVLHQWFGNYIYTDYESGNWTEGLTTYLSDHLYASIKGEGASHRKKTLMDFQSYVHDSNDFPLRGFTQRADYASKAVGYGKGMMVFHMLREHLGEKAFIDALRVLINAEGFLMAGWDDVRTAFEESLGGEDLGWFFGQWLDRKGAISFDIQNIGLKWRDAAAVLSFEVAQKTDPYIFTLPVTVLTDRGRENAAFDIKDAVEKLEMKLEGKPLGLIIDSEYSLMRRLKDKESPPVISALIGDEKKIIVAPSAQTEGTEGEEEAKDGKADVGIYGALVEAMTSQGFELKSEDSLKEEDIMTSSLLVLGTGGPALRRLFADLPIFPGKGPDEGAEGFRLSVLQNPLSASHVVAVALASDAAEVEMAARKVFRYGKDSRVEFLKGENILRETLASDRGIVIALQTPIYGVRPQEAIPLDEVILDVMEKDIIYVGEGHTNFEDHRVQLEVIRALDASGASFAIGMEMFQTPYQKALDEYVSGEAGQAEFLRSSEYFKRWSFDFNLYREIIEFARARGIPLVALNLRSEIIRKVSRGGLGALSEEEMKEIPAGMDMSDEWYRDRLREIFDMHEGGRKGNFEYFYQSQILWDETMAHSIDSYMKENPGRKMVVVTGQGHTAYAAGIPKRAHRLGGKDYAILVNSKSEELAPGMADYVIFAPPIPAPETPMMMVTLSEEEGALTVTGFPKDSVSERAGLRKGDVIVSIDGEKARTIQDVRISLYDKQKGDTLRVKVRRKRMLLKDRELEIDIKL